MAELKPVKRPGSVVLVLVSTVRLCPSGSALSGMSQIRKKAAITDRVGACGVAGLRRFRDLTRIAGLCPFAGMLIRFIISLY